MPVKSSIRKEYLPATVRTIGTQQVKYPATSLYIIESNIHKSMPTMPVGHYYDLGNSYIDVYDSGYVEVTPSTEAKREYGKDNLSIIKGRIGCSDRAIEKAIAQMDMERYEKIADKVGEKLGINPEKIKKSLKKAGRPKKRKVSPASRKARNRRHKAGKKIDVRALEINNVLYAVMFPPKRCSMERLSNNVKKLKAYMNKCLSKYKITIDIGPEATSEDNLHLNVFLYFHDPQVMSKQDRDEVFARIVRMWCKYFNNRSEAFINLQKLTEIKSYKHLRHIVDYPAKDKDDGTHRLSDKYGKVFKQSNWDLLPAGKKRYETDPATAFEFRNDMAVITNTKAPYHMGSFGRMLDQYSISELGTKYDLPLGDTIEGVRQRKVPKGLCSLIVPKRGTVILKVIHWNEVDLPEVPACSPEFMAEFKSRFHTERPKRPYMGHRHKRIQNKYYERLEA